MVAAQMTPHYTSMLQLAIQITDPSILPSCLICHLLNSYVQLLAQLQKSEGELRSFLERSLRHTAQHLKHAVASHPSRATRQTLEKKCAKSECWGCTICKEAGLVGIVPYHSCAQGPQTRAKILIHSSST